MLIGEVVISAMALPMVVDRGGTNGVDAYRLGDCLLFVSCCVRQAGRKINEVSVNDMSEKSPINFM